TIDAIRPRLVPLDAADRTHHMDLNGRHAHLQHAAAIGNQFGMEVVDRKTEGTKGLKQLFRVVERRPNEDAQIPGEARRTMERQPMGTDDDELTPMGSQGVDELVEVGRELHQSASADIRPPQRVPPAGATTSSAELAASALRRRMR